VCGCKAGAKYTAGGIQAGMLTMRPMQWNHRLVADRTAVTALEYGIVCAFFAVLLVGIFGNFGTTLVAMFTRASSAL
jgi:Flp pilus assembly pilin Flp